MTENSNYVCSYVCLTNEIKGHFQIIHFVHLHQPNYFIHLSLVLKPQFKQHSLRVSPHKYCSPREVLTSLQSPSGWLQLSACAELYPYHLWDMIKSSAILLYLV